MKIVNLQDDFSGGSISPKLLGRVKAPGYNSGVETMQNFTADSRGPVERRKGTQFIASLDANVARMAVFPLGPEGFGGNSHLYLVFTELKLTVYRPNGTIYGTDTTPWSEDELNEIQVATAPGGSVQYYTHRNHPQQKLSYFPDTGLFEFEVVVFVEPPVTWTGTNYPRAVVFHGGRMWYGGTPSDPQTFWGSQSGVYEDFALGTSQADESVVFTIAKGGAIRWMQSTKNLLIGTVSGEHIVSSVEGVITPSDIKIEQQSAYGSRGIQSIQVGDQIMYVSPDGKKLRAMQYEWSADNWLSQDLTFFSEHITTDGILATAWAQNPSNHFMCGLEDGDIAVLTYERGENIFGWHTHNYNDPVIDISRGDIEGADLKAYLIRRDTGKLYLEIEPIDTTYYLDSWIQTDFGTPNDTVTGLEHLEGREVGVIVNDAVHPNRTVSGGSITLDYPVDKVVVGLNFTSTLKTLPLDKGSKLGSAQAHMKRHNRIFVTMLESNNPKINGIRQPTRYPATPMNTAEPAQTKRTSVSETSWDRDAQITIEQDLPVPCTIISIASETAQEIL